MVKNKKHMSKIVVAGVLSFDGIKSFQRAYDLTEDYCWY